jgi:hydroxysqualene synthase
MRAVSSVSHRENFPVASWLCPSHLRPAIAAIYHFARTADDLADEGSASALERLSQLKEFRTDLLRCYATQVHRSAAASGQTPAQDHQAQPTAPASSWLHVFEPLRQVIEQFNLPLAPLLALLDAFEHDVRCTGARTPYPNRVALLTYCANSANPIGRLLLHLYGVREATALAQSDAICSALQLINFWQDLSVDRARGRHYLPHDSLSLAATNGKVATPTLSAAALQDLLDWTRGLMKQGSPLCKRIPGRAGWELRLVVQGGLRMLEKTQTQGLRALHQRPRLHAGDWLLMLWRALRM